MPASLFGPTRGVALRPDPDNKRVALTLPAGVAARGQWRDGSKK